MLGITEDRLNERQLKKQSVTVHEIKTEIAIENATAKRLMEIVNVIEKSKGNGVARRIDVTGADRENTVAVAHAISQARERGQKGVLVVYAMFVAVDREIIVPKNVLVLRENIDAVGQADARRLGTKGKQMKLKFVFGSDETFNYIAAVAVARHVLIDMDVHLLTGWVRTDRHFQNLVPKNVMLAQCFVCNYHNVFAHEIWKSFFQVSEKCVTFV